MHQRPQSRSGHYSPQTFDDVHTKSSYYNLERGQSAQVGNLSSYNRLMASPRPPAQPPSRKGRPISAKGRSRSVYHTSVDGSFNYYEDNIPQGSVSDVRLESYRHTQSRIPASDTSRVRPVSRGTSSKAVRPNSQEVGEEKAPVPPPLQARGSFSKFKPLPAIGGESDDTISNTAAVAVKSATESIKIETKDNNSIATTTQVSACTCQLTGVVPDEPSDSYPDRIKLAIKLLDGERHERWFRNSDTLGGVLAFAISLSNGNLPSCHFCTNDVPRRVFKDFSMTLDQAGLKSFTMLYLDDS